MRWYWIKIMLGAAVIFLVGMAVMAVGRRGVDEGRSLFASSDPINIPLAGVVPFQLDGREIGRLQRITIRREAPKLVSGFEVRVAVGDSLPSGLDLSACRITTSDRQDFSFEEGFVCLPTEQADSMLVVFGSVRFRGAGGLDVTVPLLLDVEVVGEIRSDEAMVEEARARFQGEAARLEADRVSTAVKAGAESAAKAPAPAVKPVTPPPPPQ